MAITFLTNEDKNVIDEQIGKLSEEIGKKEKPLVYIDGAIPTTKDNVLAEIRVVSSWLNFHAYIKIKCQGTSSMAFPKKNFTITLFKDEARTIPMMILVPGWKIASNKYVFKADWVDYSHARNVVTAQLWSETVASRADYDMLPVELRNSPNNGAITGFPILVTTNGTYQGLYNWSIGKDPFMWGMDADNPDHVLLCGEKNTDRVFAETPCNFRKLWSGVNEDMWSYEVGTESDTVKNSLNAFISCVKNTATLEGFKAIIGDHVDVNGAIDYLIFGVADCGIDNFGKNVLLGTYDLAKWRFGMYDLDLVWGLSHGGAYFYKNPPVWPDGYAEAYNLFFERLQKAFWAEIKARGAELRNTVLSYANIVSHFEKYVRTVGAEAYADDLVPYPDIPSSDTNNIWQIRNFVRDRLAYLDTWLDGLSAAVECTGLILSESSHAFDGEGTIQLATTKSPATTVDSVFWMSSDASVVTVDNTGTVTTVGNGTATVTAVCGMARATCDFSVKNYGGSDAPEEQTGVLYELSEATTFTGASGEAINTECRLWASDKDFTILADVSPAGTPGTGSAIFWGIHYKKIDGVTKYSGIEMVYEPKFIANNYFIGVNCGESADTVRFDMGISASGQDRFAVAIRHTTGSGVYGVDYKVADTEQVTEQISAAYYDTTSTMGLWIGASDNGASRAFVGTVNRFVIYDRKLTDDEVAAFIADAK